MAVCFQPCGEFVYRRPMRLLIIHHRSPHSCGGPQADVAVLPVFYQTGFVLTAESNDYILSVIRVIASLQTGALAGLDQSGSFGFVSENILPQRSVSYSKQ